MRKCMSILISALQTWTKKLIKSNAPNWNQNDADGEGYIKNRPFYEKEGEIVTKTLFQEEGIIIEDNGGYVSLSGELLFTPGQTYTVILNDEIYECIAWVNDETYCIGNGNIYGGEGMGEDVPFSCDSYTDGGWYLNTAMAGEYSLTVMSKEQEPSIIKKIDEKYLPPISNVGAEGSGKNAEIFNDYNLNEASGDYAHAEGYNTIAQAMADHAEGQETTAAGSCSHAEGYNTFAYGFSAHAEGTGQRYSITISGSAYATNYTKTSSNYIYAGDIITIDLVNFATVTKVNGSTITVSTTLSNTAVTNATAIVLSGAFGSYSHTEGYQTIASGISSHAEGDSSIASGTYSHAEGQSTQASGSRGSHAEGRSTVASGESSHAEGLYAKASGKGSHAEGESTASEQYTHAEGYQTTASGSRAHSEGEFTVASGLASHAEGSGTRAYTSCSHAQGKYNIEGALAHIVGNGTSTARSNAHTLDWDGNGWFAGEVYVGSTSGTNRDEGSKKLATEEYVNSIALPLVTAENNGAILQVIDGKWTAVQATTSVNETGGLTFNIGG